MRREQRRLRGSITKGRTLLASIGAPLATAAIVAGVCVAPAAAEGCPNEQLRREDNSLDLPDCRAYEMASPPEKQDHDVFAFDVQNQSIFQAAASGDAVTYTARGIFSEANLNPGSVNYLSTQGASEWSTVPVDEPPLGDAQPEHGTLPVVAYSKDLTETLLQDPGIPLAPGATPGVENLYLRDNVTGDLTTVTLDTIDRELNSNYPFYFGASTDFADILFSDINRHSPAAPEGVPSLYLYQGGNNYLVSVLPSGSAAPGGGEAGAGENGSIQHAISSDGSRVFFTTPENGELYVRENPATAQAVTREVSASQKNVPGEPQPATFWSARADGSEALFSSAEQLTEDDTNESTDLYRYNVGTRRLTKLTNPVTPEATIQGVLGESEDGSYIYFAGRGQTSVEPTGSEGNVYMWHDGVVTLVAADGALNAPQGILLGREQTSRVSAGGTKLVFASQEGLTGYSPTVDAQCPSGCAEVYLYDAEAPPLRCVSCRPDGGPEAGPALLAPQSLGERANAAFPAASGRSLSSDGQRIFFSSPDSLVPEDTNGKYDAYEYEGGAAHLISSGQGSGNSYFADAGENGADVFFTTDEPLVGQDVDENVDLYDAHQDGGYPLPPRASTPCAGDGCQGPPASAPGIAGPATAVASEQGNLAPVPPSPIAASKKPLTRAQKLSRALKACHTRKRHSRRKACEAQARKRYQPPRAAKSREHSRGSAAAGVRRGQ
jgi:hypothetical protein